MSLVVGMSSGLGGMCGSRWEYFCWCYWESLVPDFLEVLLSIFILAVSVSNAVSDFRCFSCFQCCMSLVVNGSSGLDGIYNNRESASVELLGEFDSR